MRLCLAVLVILSHSFELLDGNRSREPLTRLFHTLSFGELAVDGFFVLSGYLIVKSWERRPVLLSYLQKRVYRIYPGFIVASLICALIVGPLGSQISRYFSQFSPIDYIISVFMLNLPAVPPVFSGLPHPEVNGSMWTISYEFRCYLAVALFGLAGAVKNRWIWLAIAVSALMLSVLPVPIIDRIAFNGSFLLIERPDQFFRLFAFFAAGGAFYLFREKIRYSMPAVCIAAIIAIAAMFNGYTAQIALTTFGAYAFFGLGFKHFRGLQWHKSWPDISYGVYLYGWPCQILLHWYFRSINPYLLFLSALMLAAGCGWLSWRFVESPFMKRKPDNLLCSGRTPS